MTLDTVAFLNSKLSSIPYRQASFASLSLTSVIQIILELGFSS